MKLFQPIGAILNEVDGNLTLCKKSTGLTTLHWQGKLRGVEFEPALFRIEMAHSPEVIDIKGRLVELPVLKPATDAILIDSTGMPIDEVGAAVLALVRSSRPSGT